MTAYTMRLGAPTLEGRVAPRCNYAEGLLLINVHNGCIVQHRQLSATIRTPAELTAILELHNVDTLISGGVESSVRRLLDNLGIRVIDNVSQTTEELLSAISLDKRFLMTSENDNRETCIYLTQRRYSDINCLTCSNRECFSGKSAIDDGVSPCRTLTPTEKQMLEAAMDITKETPRRLCRLSEIIYFCIEMNYQRIGLAYCTELEDATRILVNVLNRFFHVVPVCCKVGGIKETELYAEDNSWLELNDNSFVCNPLGQAYVLNNAKTQFNLVVGLCVGADALFGRATMAPASTLFVKDKSLANNPIGALYSEYYLKESVSQATGRQPKKRNTINREEP